MSKETCVHVKRDLCTYQNVTLSRELVLCRLLRARESHSERERKSLVKERIRESDSLESKETCIHVKRDLYTCQNITLEREWVLRKLLRERESHSQRERESLVKERVRESDSLESKETYIHVKRDLYTCQKRPVYMSNCHSRERVGLAQALARERESLSEREWVL